MQTKNKISLIRKALYGILLLVLFLSVFGSHGLSSASAQEATVITSGYVLSDGQFVYGPNIGNFDLRIYLAGNASHLLHYADDLYGRSEYYSINPKVYLTLLEIHSNLVSVPNVALMEDSFGLNNGDFLAQIESLSNKMSDAYYLHLYTYSSLPVSQRNLEPFVTPSGVTINVSPDTNAGTYAVIAGLAAMDEQNISLILDNSRVNGFYQTYTRLFGNDDPLDEANYINVPGGIGALAAPDNLLQLPYLNGLSWLFGGVHNTNGTTNFTDASSLDFYPWPIAWGADTSNMWVVAAASGIPTRYSDCGFKVSHSGAVNFGWETNYYHLEGARYLSGSINQNDKIGVIANTFAEATCTGGFSSGPHVHFSLKYNGAYVAINGTPLSGWYVHSGRYSYDTDPNYMWLDRAGVKKYSYSDSLVSEGSTTQVMSVNNADIANGTITSSPSGINCGLDCTETYFSNTTVTLTATPAAGYMLAGWGGACSGNGKSCVVTMSDAKFVTAAFTLKSFLDTSLWTSSFDLSHGWTVQNSVRTVGDVSGDGKDDLVGFGQDGVYVAVSTGSGFGSVSKLSSSFGLANGWTVNNSVRTVGDVSGDGKADLVGFGADGVYVAISTGSGFGSVSKLSSSFGLANGWTVQNSVRTLGDVTGDEKADLIGFGADGVYVAVATETGFETVAKWSTGFGLANGWTVQGFVRTVGDISGDGKADLVGFGADGVYVAVATGTGFGAVSKWSSNFGLANGWTVQDFVRTIGDVNDDDRADLIGFGLDGVYVALSNGTGLGAISRWTDDFDLSHGWTVKDFARTLGNVSLDGKVGLIGFGLDGVYVAIAREIP